MSVRAKSPRAVWTPLLAAGLFVLTAGCTQRVALQPPAEGPVGGTNVYVLTVDGTEYHFRWAAIEDSTLTGHYKVEEEVTRDGQVAVIDGDRAVPVPLSQVERIERKRIDLGKTAFLAGGVAVVGLFIKTLLPEDTTKKPADTGGKPLPVP